MKLTYGLVLALYASLACAQDFERLFIRPSIDSGVFDNSELNWLSAEDWPTSSPNFVALQAPDAGVSRYTATWPADAPPEKYCLFIDAAGQMSLSGCFNTTVRLPMTRGILLNHTDDNLTCLLDREVNVESGTDLFWVPFECSTGEHVIFYVIVPADLPDEPILQMWAYSSTGFGTTDYVVKRVCLSPDDGDDLLSISAWDDTYNDSHTFGAAQHLQRVQFEQSNWFPATDDLCWFSIEHDSLGSVTYWLFQEAK